MKKIIFIVFLGTCTINADAQWNINGNFLALPTDYIGTNSGDDFNIHSNGAFRGRVTFDGCWDLGVGNTHAATADPSATIGNNHTITNGRYNLTTNYGNTLTDATFSVSTGENNIVRRTDWGQASGYDNLVDTSAYSFAFGKSNQIQTQQGAIAAGWHNNIIGGNHVAGNIALGHLNTISYSGRSAAIGDGNNINTGSNSCVSIGMQNSIATGDKSITLGYQNQVSSTGEAHAYGSQVNNTLSGSIAMGFNSRTVTITANGVGIMGSGTSYAPSHALEVDASVTGNADVAFINLPTAPTKLPAVLYDPTTGVLYQSTINYSRPAPGGDYGNEVIADDAILMNSKPIQNAGELVGKLNPQIYQLDGNKYPTLSLSNKEIYGLNAQDVEQVLPGLVSEIAVPEDANDATVKTINYNELVPILIQSIKELQANIRDLQATRQNESLTSLSLSLTDKDQILLQQNNPNPCASEAAIGFNIPMSVQSAVIKFSSIEGRIIANYVISARGKGILNVSTADLSAGNYTYSLYADGQLIDTKKMVVTK